MYRPTDCGRLPSERNDATTLRYSDFSLFGNATGTPPTEHGSSGKFGRSPAERLVAENDMCRVVAVSKLLHSLQSGRDSMVRIAPLWVGGRKWSGYVGDANIITGIYSDHIGSR
jgi:hypothetical protein